MDKKAVVEKLYKLQKAEEQDQKDKESYLQIITDAQVRIMRSKQSLDRLNLEFEKKSFDIETLFDKYSQAPGDVSALMNAVMVLLNLDWTVVPKESFQSIKTIVREKVNIIQLLKSIDRDSYDVNMVKKLERFTNIDNFYEEHMRGICDEAGILCEWVLALIACIKDKSTMQPNNQRYSDLVS